MDSGVLPRPARAGGADAAWTSGREQASSRHGTRSQLRSCRRLHPAGRGDGRRLRALVHGRERLARLRPVRDLLHRQRQRPRSRQPGALPRRRRRPRAAAVDRQARRQPHRRGRGNRPRGADQLGDARQPRPAGRHRPAVHQPERSAEREQGRAAGDGRALSGHRLDRLGLRRVPVEPAGADGPRERHPRRASAACSRTRTSTASRTR